jgi:hypothetical protein
MLRLIGATRAETTLPQLRQFAIHTRVPVDTVCVGPSAESDQSAIVTPSVTGHTAGDVSVRSFVVTSWCRLAADDIVALKAPKAARSKQGE